MTLVRQVWSHNLPQELALLNACLSQFPVVAFDTEFTGFLRCTPRGAPQEHFYEDLKFNVNHLKILQLGLTLANESGDVAMTWEFNFSDFDETTDLHSPTSIQFLKSKGFDFNKHRNQGIPSPQFRRAFLPICCSNRIAKWLTFHGFYDVAYLLKLLMIKTMPQSLAVFAAKAQRLLGTVSDLKHIIRNCDYLLNGELGLEKLAKLLDVERNGTAHHAGSDSLLTASVYVKMKKRFEFSPEHCDGFLYGLHYRIRRRPVIGNVVIPPFRQPPVSVVRHSLFSGHVMVSG